MDMPCARTPKGIGTGRSGRAGAGKGVRSRPGRADKASELSRRGSPGTLGPRPQKLGYTDIAERLAPSLLQQRLTESQHLHALLLGQLLVLAKKLAYGVAKLGRKVAQELREFRPPLDGFRRVVTHLRIPPSRQGALTASDSLLVPERPRPQG